MGELNLIYISINNKLKENEENADIVLEG